jgi:enamine deaminase RidA (YjgF/YER057c/UK114 family)
MRQSATNDARGISSARCINFFVPPLSSLSKQNTMLSQTFCCLASRLSSSSRGKIVTGAQNRSVASAISRAVTRIGVDDPRMSKIVIYNGTVYISGQTDTTASDSTCAKSDLLGTPLSSFLTHLSRLFCSPHSQGSNGKRVGQSRRLAEPGRNIEIRLAYS